MAHSYQAADLPNVAGVGGAGGSPGKVPLEWTFNRDSFSPVPAMESSNRIMQARLAMLRCTEQRGT